MANQYFNYLPNFAYVSREPDAQILDFVLLKNIFRRVKLSNEVIGDLSNFTLYKIKGDERPDQVAFKLYGDQDLDWLVMLANNTLNQYEEWPMSNVSFYNYMIRKYGSESNFTNPHHYETRLVKDSLGVTMVKKGLRVPSDYTVTYLDSNLGTQTLNPVDMISNYEHESNLQDAKRNIYVLKAKFVNLAIELIETELLNEKGTSQYVSDDLSRGDNIRLYQ